MIFRIIAGLIAVATAGGGYLSFKYSTTSTCEAARSAVAQEMPRILEDLQEDNTAARITGVIGGLTGSDNQLEALALAEATEGYEDKSAMECLYMVAERELSPSSFRAGVVEDLEGRLEGVF